MLLMTNILEPVGLLSNVLIKEWLTMNMKTNTIEKKIMIRRVTTVL